MDKIKSFIKEHFILLTVSLYGILSLLYIWKGLRESFSVWGWIIIGFNLLYIPLAFIFKKKCFTYFNLVYAIVLIFVLAFTKTCLYNNYSALFVIFLLMMMKGGLYKIALPLYFAAVSVAFAFNEETLYHYLIHIFRSLWFITVMILAKDEQYSKKHTLILYDDEKEILSQLASGKVYQKEIVGFSENTIYRKLKAARERNGNLSRQELVELYKKEYPQDK